MRRSILACATVLALQLSASGAMAQQAQPAAVDPARLQAAREVVRKAQADRTAILNSMAAPMAGLVQQMGVAEPDRAQSLVKEVVMPTLSERYDDLVDIQAQAYASALSVPDLKAISAFYDSPAGRNLLAAQPKLAQAQVGAMSQWMGAIAPTLQSKLSAAIKAHGWDRK